MKGKICEGLFGRFNGFDMGWFRRGVSPTYRLKQKTPMEYRGFERITGLEPATSTLARLRSTS